MSTILKEKYKSEVMKALREEFKIDNVMAIPKIEKIVINSGLGEAKNNPALIEEMVEEMGQIAGQRPVITKTRKAISNFKIRENMPIGVKVTLRGDRMWFFLEKLINVVLPRIKDFRGLETGTFDGNGNYALGLKDQTVFPEIDPTKVTKIKPLQIIVNTSAKVDDQALFLLKSLGLPFKKN